MQAYQEKEKPFKCDVVYGRGYRVQKTKTFSCFPCMLACTPIMPSQSLLFYFFPKLCSFLVVSLTHPLVCVVELLVGCMCCTIPPMQAAWMLTSCASRHRIKYLRKRSCHSLPKARIHNHGIPLGATEKILDIDVVGKALRRLAKER